MPRTPAAVWPRGTESVLATIRDPERVRTRAIDRAAYAADASHYLLTPSAVVIAETAGEVASALRAATASGSPVTFRSGGTSLAGQASSTGLLIDVRQRFRRVDVLDEGRRVRAQPGATVRHVNARLARWKRRLGPDPASEAACTIGGVVANNSSGMACGITENTYRTLESMIFVLPSGTIVDTARPDANAHLRACEPDLFEGLQRLQRRVRADSDSVATITRQYQLKNTMGYGLNSFLDCSTPVDLLQRLIIGSEGTLAFVAEATYATVPIQPLVSTALMVFDSLDAATNVLPDLVATGAATLELMDSTSIRVGQGFSDAPNELRGWDVGGEAALLVEYRADEPAELSALVAEAGAAVDRARLSTPAEFTTDSARRASMWRLRKGLYASIAGARPSGTTALLEDVVVPVPELAETCLALQGLFARYDYSDSVIFGHAKDGNIHFMLTDRFEGAGLERLEAFTDDMVDLVLDAGGNLKAEHGTGRAMAPYVRRQFGDELYDVMVEVKRLCDPAGILNPGVIFEEDAQAHLRSIKLNEPIEAEADRCVECGYCEPVCPSRNLTLTPRQRIAVRRAVVHAEKNGDHDLARDIERDYTYEAVETCAADGMCGTVCPVLIDTGSLVKRLRREQQNPVLGAGWSAAARAWAPLTRAGATALSVANAMPAGIARSATTAARAVLGADLVPAYSADLPKGGDKRAPLTRRLGAVDGELSAIYLPACVNSMFGPTGDGIGVTEAFTRLLERAGVHVAVPDDIEHLCCGTPWSSKGYSTGRDVMAEKVADAVRGLSPDGSLPIISDASSCTEGFAHILRDLGLTNPHEDAVTFTARSILPRLDPGEPVAERLVLHPTCSSTQMGIDDDLQTVAARVAREVTVPVSWGCCGFAGDRGMLHPELTASATSDEAAEVRAAQADAHASCNRTCEIGMSRATGRSYRHVLELLEEATRS